MKKIEIMVQIENGEFVIEKVKLASSGSLLLIKPKQNSQGPIEEFFPVKILRNQK